MKIAHAKRKNAFVMGNATNAENITLYQSAKDLYIVKERRINGFWIYNTESYISSLSKNLYF